MDVQCKGLEKDLSFTVGSDRTEVIERSGGTGTIWSPLEDQGGYGMWSVSVRKVNIINYSLNTTVTHTTPPL